MMVRLVLLAVVVMGLLLFAKALDLNALDLLMLLLLMARQDLLLLRARSAACVVGDGPHGDRHGVFVCARCLRMGARAEKGRREAGGGGGRFPSRSRVGRAPDTEANRASGPREGENARARACTRLRSRGSDRRGD